MKKLIALLFSLLICFSFVLTTKADAIEEEEIVEVGIEEEPPVEEEPLEEHVMTFEEFKEYVQNEIAKISDESLAIKIIGWLVDSGVLVAMFSVFLKYQKYKHTTTEEVINEVKSQVGNHLKENFDKLSDEQIKKLITSIDELKEAEETIMKVLVLMQDQTSAGKVALLDYLGSKTKNEEVKEQAKVEVEKLEEKIKVQEEVKETLNEEYKNIF